MRVRSYDQIGILGNSLNSAWLRQSILADNIANIDTPGFKRSDVSFQQHLARALEPSNRIDMKRSTGRHIDAGPQRDPARVTARTFAELDTSARNDGNNVNPEAEMSHIAANTMYYQALAQLASSNLRSLNTIVTRAGAA